MNGCMLARIVFSLVSFNATIGNDCWHSQHRSSLRILPQTLTNMRVFEQGRTGVKQVAKRPLRWAHCNPARAMTNGHPIGQNDAYHGGFICCPWRTWHQQPQAGLLRLDTVFLYLLLYSGSLSICAHSAQPQHRSDESNWSPTDWSHSQLT